MVTVGDARTCREKNASFAAAAVGVNHRQAILVLSLKVVVELTAVGELFLQLVLNSMQMSRSWRQEVE